MRATPNTTDPAFAWDYLADDPVAVLRATAARSSWEPVGLGWDPMSVNGDGLARAGSMLRAWPGERPSPDDATATTRRCLSQLLHGEQAALLAAGRLIELLPQLEAKRFASAMAGEESRHLEAMARYLELRFGGIDPIADAVAAVYDGLLADDRWDVVLAGSQIVVEGLASAACHLIAAVSGDPVLARILRRIDDDERRHLAFARLLLPQQLAALPPEALVERLQAVADVVDGVRAAVTGGDAPMAVTGGEPVVAAVTAGHLVATGVVPGLEAVGLLDAAGGWLRARLTANATGCEARMSTVMATGG